MLSTPRNEFPEFPAALSFVFEIPPEEALAALERRVERLRESVAALDRELQSEGGPPRLFLLEAEYVRAVTAAELDWVSGVVDELRAGRMAWSYEQIAEVAKQFPPPE